MPQVVFVANFVFITQQSFDVFFFIQENETFSFKKIKKISIFNESHAKNYKRKKKRRKFFHRIRLFYSSSPHISFRSLNYCKI